MLDFEQKLELHAKLRRQGLEELYGLYLDFELDPDEWVALVLYPVDAPLEVRIKGQANYLWLTEEFSEVEEDEEAAGYIPFKLRHWTYPLYQGVFVPVEEAKRLRSQASRRNGLFDDRVLTYIERLREALPLREEEEEVEDTSISDLFNQPTHTQLTLF